VEKTGLRVYIAGEASRDMTKTEGTERGGRGRKGWPITFKERNVGKKKRVVMGKITEKGTAGKRGSPKKLFYADGRNQ